MAILSKGIVVETKNSLSVRMPSGFPDNVEYTVTRRANLVHLFCFQARLRIGYSEYCGEGVV